MFFNETNIRLTEQRRKDLQREADQQRQAQQYTRRAPRKDEKKSPLWTRVWTLL